MATVDIESATSTLSNTDFIMSVMLVVGGSIFATVATNWLRKNLVDIEMKGGDAIYSVAAAALALTVLPEEYGRPLALGTTAAGARVALAEYEII